MKMFLSADSGKLGRSRRGVMVVIAVLCNVSSCAPV